MQADTGGGAEGRATGMFGRGLKAFFKPTMVPRVGEGEFQHQMHAGMAESVWIRNSLWWLESTSLTKATWTSPELDGARRTPWVRLTGPEYQVSESK